MLESEIKRGINEMEKNLGENNDLVDSEKYHKTFDCINMAKNLLNFGLEELDGI